MDPYDTEPTVDYTAVTVATGVNAVLWFVRAKTERNGGARQQLTVRLTCDPVDLQHEDTVTDERSGRVYKVQRCETLTYVDDPDMDHTTGTLTVVLGEK